MKIYFHIISCHVDKHNSTKTQIDNFLCTRKLCTQNCHDVASGVNPIWHPADGSSLHFLLELTQLSLVTARYHIDIWNKNTPRPPGECQLNSGVQEAALNL